MPELQETTTDSSVIAATTPTDAPPSSATADDAADVESPVAASEPQDDIARLEAEYRKNILAPEDEAEQPDEPAEQPEQVAAEETAEEVVEPDPLAPTGPRTLEALKQQFPRVPTVALEEIARVDKVAHEANEKLTALGGEVGIGIANEVMPLLLKASPTGEDADKLLDHLFLTNQNLGIEASKLLLDKALSEEDIDPDTKLPIGVATANAMIAKHLDAAYDVEKLEKLIAYDKAGLIDHEELDKDLAVEGESETVKALKAELAAVKDVQQREQAEKERTAQATAQQHYVKATNHVANNVMTALLPIAEQYGWTATKEELNSDKSEVKELAESKVALGEMLTAWMNQRLHQLPEWSAIDHLARSQQAFNDDGNPTHLFTVNSEPIRNKIVAEFKEKVRTLNKTFAKSFGSTRAATKAKTVQKRPVDEVPSTKKVEAKTDDPIELARQQYRESIRQARAQATG